MSYQKLVLVIEPHVEGHHGPYLEWTIKGLVDGGFRVVVQTLETSATHFSFATLRSFPVDILEMTVMPGMLPLRVGGEMKSLVSREWGYWKKFREWYRYATSIYKNIDMVYMPYMDYCLYAIGACGSPYGKTAWSGLCMRPSFHYQEMDIIAPNPAFAGIKKSLYFRVLTNRFLKALFTIDEPLYEYLNKSVTPTLAKKIAFMPEPADAAEHLDPNESKKSLDLPVDRKLLLVYGALTRRKGIQQLVASMLSTSFPDNVDVVLAGRMDEEINSFLAMSNYRELIDKRRIFIYNEFVESWKEALFFSAADMVWLGYVKHYNASGVLVQAARYAKPVIACREGVLGWQAKRHDMGLVVDVSNEEAIVKAVRKLADDRAKGKKFGQNGADAYAGHTKNNAMEILRQNIGIDASG